jgi:1-acyl-sn-glycerol-3-phosphate acyltransferase
MSRGREKPFSEAESNRLLYANSHRTVTVLGGLGLGFKVFGQENIPDTGGGIIAANHRHWLDILVLPSAVPRRHVSMVAKHEVFSTPIMGPFFEKWGALPIHREQPLISELRAIIEKVREGRLVGIFPEETRDKSRVKSRHEADLSEFQSGTAMIARRTKADTVPAVVYRTDEWLTRMHAVAFGEPMEPPTGSDDVWTRQLMGRIEDLYSEVDQILS